MTKLTGLINYADAFHDSNNEWDSTNCKFTPVQSGTYMFLTNIVLKDTNNIPLISRNMPFKLYKNGSNFGETYYSVPSGSFSYTIPLIAGDYVEFYCYPSVTFKVNSNKIYINKIV